MAATPSTMMPLGTQAPSFSLLDTVSDKKISLDKLKGSKGTVVMFICNHCPYVLHLNNALTALANEFLPKGVSFIGISANDAEAYPQDGPALMKLHASKEGYPFPYLYDETQEVARAYDAACTPDFFVFDKQLACTYRGQFDSTRPNKGSKATGADLRAALEALTNEQPPIYPQYPSIGCNIKWKK